MKARMRRRGWRARTRRTGLRNLSVGIVVALALLAIGASAMGSGKVAAACSNESVNGGKYVGKLTLRFVLQPIWPCRQ
jgi:hypothetical protein